MCSQSMIFAIQSPLGPGALGSAVWDTQGFLKEPGHTGQVENPCLPGAGPVQKRWCLCAGLHIAHRERCCGKAVSEDPRHRARRAWGSRLPIPCNSYTVSVLFLYCKITYGFRDSHILKNIEKLRNQERLFKSWRKCMRFSRKNYGSQVFAGKQNSRS